jgi:hypothetical protein
MISRRLLTGISTLFLGSNPLASLEGWLGEVAPRVVVPPEEVSRKLARTRRPGRGGPWLPPFLARWLRSPGCRQYAVVLVKALRGAGHPAILVLGVSPQGAHVWVECRGRAYDLGHPGGTSSEVLRRRFPLVKEIGTARSNQSEPKV